MEISFGKLKLSNKSTSAVQCESELVFFVLLSVSLGRIVAPSLGVAIPKLVPRAPNVVSFCLAQRAITESSRSAVAQVRN